MTTETRALLHAMPRWPLYMGGSLMLLIMSPRLLGHGPPLLVQMTASEAQGVYWLRPVPATLTHGMHVTMPVPPDVASFVYEHGWIPRTWLGADVVLVKTVAALPGDAYCITEAGVWIHGVWQAPVFRQIGGVDLPVLRGCWTLAPGMVFLFSAHLDHAFDGRYFGAVPITSLQRLAVPVWTWGD